ncbi:MAG: SDR family NAD(P)-dependent oxidoreductase, partial [Chlamydiae bacterium]|nr:SDR family NAD(P)-dependent oxidoreductase [Chlamydiota bacterium]
RIPVREQYLRGQTPQSFYLPTILEAHEKAIKDSYSEATDDCSLLTRIGKHVFIVEGDEHNIKITTELDLFLAEQILRLSQKATQSKNIQNVKNKTYVVTGGTGGIGSAICSRLESMGAKAIPISKNSKEYQANLCNPEQVQQIFEEIHLQYGKIDGLINCIGSMIYQPFKTLDPKQIIDLVETNLIASLYCCKYAQINSGGHILNITSSSYFKGRKNYAVYSACKAAIVNFTQGLSEELPDLCVNAFAPQRTLTPLRLLNFPSEPFDHLLDKEDVATSVVQILSQHNLTGSIFDLRKSYTHMGSQDSDTNRKLQPII